MLSKKIEEIFRENGGEVTCEHINKKEGKYVLIQTEDKKGFQLKLRGKAFGDIYSIEKFDALEEALRKVAEDRFNKVLISQKDGGYRLGESPKLWDLCLNSLIGRYIFQHEDGKVLARWSTYIAPLLEAVGFCEIIPSRGLGGEIKLA